MRLLFKVNNRKDVHGKKNIDKLFFFPKETTMCLLCNSYGTPVVLGLVLSLRRERQSVNGISSL